MEHNFFSENNAKMKMYNINIVTLSPICTIEIWQQPFKGDNRFKIFYLNNYLQIICLSGYYTQGYTTLLLNQIEIFLGSLNTWKMMAL